MTLELTQDEINALRGLLDAAVRHAGAQAAPVVAHFMQRLSTAEQESDKRAPHDKTNGVEAQAQ